MKVGTVDENLNIDNHDKYVTRQIQGGLLRKILRIRAVILSLKKISLETFISRFLVGINLIV